MRILLVGAGAAVSTKDVEDGYHVALREADASIAYYNLSARLDLTRKWLHMLWRERGKISEDRPRWPDVIYRASVEALEMALRLNVDWVLLISGMFFHPDVLKLLRDAGKRTAVILTESPYEDAKQAEIAHLADMCWTNERTSVERLRLANPHIGYLPHAYDPRRHSLFMPPLSDAEAHDVVFVGSGFQERIEVLEQVSWDGINLGLYGEWSLLGSRHKLRQYVRGGALPNDRTVALYRRAHIGLNLHRSSTSYGRRTPRVAHAESMNPRACELAACGVFSLSDWRPELEETLGDSVPTFRSADELERQIRTYLNHSPERQRLARLARQRILPHTFSARAEQLLGDLDQFETAQLRKGA